ncbi:ArsR/SmtB family transcription factor [Halomicroarcula sp. GCM10025324]|uniref:ArsR/SmtB family transcription factor n=1 Tax=Haloarcula TaxID=2237 RepID=UPI0023E87802|nr:helix-turn-helix domain-containing protein [Halomicroarcula sp. ZS-22-S1]
MTDSTVSESPLEAAAGTAGPHAVEAFKLLSDETRLAILLALWEHYDPHAEDNSVPFSTLYDRVNMGDSGTFTYHLDKLVDTFVEKTSDGYQLRNSGLTIVRAIIAGTGLEDARLTPTEIPRSCYHCGASVELSYKDDRLYQICTECEANVGPDSSERAPTGTLMVYDNFNPAGLTHRAPADVFVASTIEYHRAVTLLIRGVCPECSGPVEESLHICDSHESPPGEVCSTCGTWNEARVRYVCSVCKYGGSYPAWVAAFDHPAIVAFYYDHGFQMTFDLDDAETCARAWDRLAREQTLVSEDPVRIRVTVPCGGEELYLTLNENLNVIDVTESNN